MPRPKLSVSRGRALTIRKFFNKTDKQVGELAKSIGITRDQWYLSQNPLYLQLKKGRYGNGFPWLPRVRGG